MKHAWNMHEIVHQDAVLNEARKLLLETRLSVNLLELAYDYYEKN